MNALGRLGLASLTLLLVACAQAPGASPTPSPSPAPSPTRDPMAIGTAPPGPGGRQFLSTGVTKDGAPFDLAAGSRIRLIFGDGQLTANAGCNTIGGHYDFDDSGRLIFSGASMTEMACQEPLMAQDQWLIGFLSGSPTFALDGNNLTLTSGTTVVTLLDREVAQPDQPLVGPAWSLTTLINGNVASSVPSDISAAISFAADGGFQMNDGCNSGGGRYVVDGAAIRFSDVVMTEMACGGAAGQVEQAVLAVIGSQGAIALAIDAGSLSLSAGAAGLQFTAVQQ